MEQWGRVREWLGIGKSPTIDTTSDEIREAMELARQAQRSEDYTRALSALDRAMHVADEEKDAASVTIIALHQADVLMLQGQYDEAEQLLQTVQQTAEAVNQPGFASYALSSLGALYQHRGDWEQARETYERAREVAQEAQSDGAEGRAMGHLADVYLHENNASYAVHLLQESLPKLNAAGDLELSSYFVGRLGEAMIATGQETEGYQLLDRAFKLGEQLRNKRMMRRWATTIGDKTYEQQRYQQAYTYYKQALPLYDADPTVAYVNTLVRVSRTCLNLGEREEALIYAQQAVQVSGQGDDASLQALAAGALGIALRANGDYTEAAEHLRTAVDNTASDADPLGKIDLLRQLAAVQAATNQPDGAEAAYQQALTLAQSAEREDAQAEVHRDLGLFYAGQQKLTEAVQEWTIALGMFETSGSNNQVARLYCDIASARRQLGQGQRAIRDYEQALITLNHVDDIGTRGLVLSNAANAYTDQGDIESAAAFFRESIEIARKIGDDAALSTRQGNYGWFLIGTGKPRSGIEQLTAAIDTSEQLNLTLQNAVQTDNLGLAYDSLSQYKTALEYHESAQQKLDTLDAPPARWQAMFKANTARTKLSLGLVEEANALLAEALEIARTTTDFEALAYALVSRARGHLGSNALETAQQNVTEAVQIARKADMRRVLAEALTVYSEQQAAAGQRERSRELWEEARRLHKMVGSPQAKQTPFWLEDSTGKATE